MGIGVGYGAKTVRLLPDGSLPKEECGELARQAAGIASNLLLEAGIHHLIRHFDETARTTGTHDVYGFCIKLLGPGEGCVDLLYRWERFPGSRDSRLSGWDSQHYAKTQFARNPVLTHRTVCRIAMAWTQAGLAEEPWDDLDYMEDQDLDRARREMREFQGGLEEIMGMFNQAGIPAFPGTAPGPREDDAAWWETVIHRARSGIETLMEPELSRDIEAAHAAPSIIEDDVRSASLAGWVPNTALGPEEMEAPGGILEQLEELYGRYQDMHERLARTFPEGRPEHRPDEELAAMLFAKFNHRAVQHLQGGAILQDPGDPVREAHQRAIIRLARESQEASLDIGDPPKGREPHSPVRERLRAEAEEHLEDTGRIAETCRAGERP